MEKMGELECYGVFSEENVIQVPFTYLAPLYRVRSVQMFRLLRVLVAQSVVNAGLPFYQLLDQL